MDIKNRKKINEVKGLNLKSFAIHGLFGTRDVYIPFNKNIKILIGENGLGKTSMLNALYYTLIGNFVKLNSIVFRKIVIEFNSGKSVEISKEDLQYYQEYPQEDFNDFVFTSGLRKKRRNFRTHELSTKQISLLDKELKSKRTIIKNEIKEEILYFPTYRRIEEELQNLDPNKIEIDVDDEPLRFGSMGIQNDDKRLIRFGMEDVKQTFEAVISDIKNSAIAGFSSITGQMLSQYVDGLHKIDREIQEQIKPDILKIILERVGENITEDYKDKIIELVNSKQIFKQQEEYKYLVNFLSNLISIYNQQKKLDDSIENFANVCNGYLIGKKVIYNKSKVTIRIIQIKNEQEIELKNLSSGEKQIISLFAKIYLEQSANLIVLFDEPELSLSIEWQKKLLPDILNSNKCNLLLTVTHSPFIFDNNLDLIAEDMNKYVKEI